MKIESNCPECGHPVETEDEKDVQCPSCGLTVHWQGSTPWIDPNEDRAVASAKVGTKKLQALLSEHQLEIDYCEADWRDTESLITESHRLLLKHPGWQVHYVGGDSLGIDSNFVYFTSKPIDDELLQQIADLVTNEGAELPGEIPIICPKCRHEIECLVGSYPASIPARAVIINGKLDIDSTEARINDCIDGEPESWHCPECDEVLFGTKAPDYLDKMEAFLKGGL